MYNYMDTSGFIAAIYFPILVVIGSFIMLQLFLAVIMDTFSDSREKMQKEHLDQITRFKTFTEIDRKMSVKDRKMSMIVEMT